MNTESPAINTVEMLRNIEPAPTHIISAPADGLYALLIFGALGLASLIWAFLALIRQRNVVPLLLCAGAAFDVNPTRVTTAFDQTHGWTNSLHVRTFADVNGDGMEDACGFGLDGIYVALSQ